MKTIVILIILSILSVPVYAYVSCQEIGSSIICSNVDGANANVLGTS